MSISGPEKQEADLELWVNSPLNYSGNAHSKTQDDYFHGPSNTRPADTSRPLLTRLL